MTLHSDSEPEYEATSPRTFPSANRRSRMIRSTTVMTAHSDSEQDYESTISALLTDTKEERPMRDTTVTALHSNSDRDMEKTRDFVMSHYPALPVVNERTSIIVDNVLTNVTSDDVDHIHFKSDVWHSFEAVDNRHPTKSCNRNKAWYHSGSSDEDQVNSNGRDRRRMYIQSGHSNFNSQYDEEESEAENRTEEEDYSNRCSGNYDNEDGGRDDYGCLKSKNVLGSYFLAPMGFEDDESIGNSSGIEGYSEAAERFQMLAGVNEFDESDQIGLENHTYQVIPKNKRRDQERMLENKRRQGKLLLVSLLDNFCLLYDQSPERNRKLFYVICKTLSNMGIIDEEYLEEMSAVRSSYQRAFRSLVLSALTSIKHEQTVLESRRIMAPPSTPTVTGKVSLGSTVRLHGPPDPFSSKDIVSSGFLHTPSTTDSAFGSSLMMRTLSFGDMFDNDPTRYKHDFVELCKLGKGGFASVFKARNKLDGIEYAIKKVRLRGGAKMKYEKIFREIKFLARLDHKNVIRYYSSWLEHADYPVSRRGAHNSDRGYSNQVDTNGELDDDYDDEYEEDEYTNTISVRGNPITRGRRRRASADYHSSYKGRRSTDPEDLSMRIVFGEEEANDTQDEEEVRFVASQDASGSGSSNADRSDPGSVFDGFFNNQHKERANPTLSTYTARSIPSATADRSQDLDDSESSLKSKRHQPSSYSALSSSIEEIQRPSPSSYSGLGSRYNHLYPKDQGLKALENCNELRPYSFPDLNRPNKGGIIDGGREQLCGFDKPECGLRQLHNNAGQLVMRDLTLFIQMQLCQTTLQDYLIYRNERPSAILRKDLSPELGGRINKTSRLSEQITHSAPGSPKEQNCRMDLVDPAVNQHIFHAIVEGVAYIHDQDMIHRDLKPGNIFLGMPPGFEHHRAQPTRQGWSDQGPSSSTVLPTHPGSMNISIDDPEPNSTLMSKDKGQASLTKEDIQHELFLNIESMVPKIGDFGLVTDMDGGVASEGDISHEGKIAAASSTSASSPSRRGAAPLLRRHSSSGIGIILDFGSYASPEQLARPNFGYDQKADIYSLGIIFFELYHPFSTLMERHTVLRNLRNGELPPDFVSRWPKEAAFVLWLMAEDPRMRPTAREILEFDLIRKSKESPLFPSGVTSMASNESQREAGAGKGRDINIICSYGREGSTSEEVGLRMSNETLEKLQGLELSASSELMGPVALEATNTANACAEYTTRKICEDCQSRCRCFEKDISNHTSDFTTGDNNGDFMNKNSIHRGFKSSSTISTTNRSHHSSKSLSSTKVSKSELEQRLKSESDKVKRLEMSLEAMRAENKALLDRIQALEHEKEMSYRTHIENRPYS
ncbi:Eukaryotic translation initiation factor 2-alpha kinase [Lobosporangium transversale]|nr:Eukaryotic translation initiation factor 2-alpha kinase [Lobosporangium transversale]